MKISCSLISSVSLLRRRTRTLMGAAYVASPGLTLLHVVLGGLVHGVVDKGQLQITGVVGDPGDILKDLPQSLIQEPLVGLLLNLQQFGISRISLWRAKLCGGSCHRQRLLILSVAILNDHSFPLACGGGWDSRAKLSYYPGPQDRRTLLRVRCRFAVVLPLHPFWETRSAAFKTTHTRSCWRIVWPLCQPGELFISLSSWGW